MAGVMQVATLFGDRNDLWSGADKAHLAAKDVDELWKFIEAEAPQKSAEPRVSGIVVVFVRFTSVLGAIDIELTFAAIVFHCSKLVDGEGLLAFTYALLAVEHALSKAQPDRQSDSEDDRTENEKNQQPNNRVKRPLEPSLIGRTVMHDPKIVSGSLRRTIDGFSRL